MTEERDQIKARRANYELKARGLKSYVQELTDMAAQHSTGGEHVEDDLAKAKADLEFYECQIGDCAHALGDHPSSRRVFQVYADAAGEWRWRLVAGNDQVIATSGEGYRDRADCLHGIELVKGSRDAKVEGAD